MTKKIIYWLPRILGLLFVLFLSLFALDVFDAVQGWAVVPALLMHLWPALVLLALLVVGWKYELVGAATFLFFAAYYVWLVGFDRHWSWYATISLPALVVGILFFVNWLQKKKLKK